MASFVHVFKICTVFYFFFVLVCIILTTFVYLQRKRSLQLQGKHIKILKKQKNINTAQIKWHAWRKKRKEKKKNTNRLLKKKILGTVKINVKMLWNLFFIFFIFYLIYIKLRSQQLGRKYCENNKLCTIFFKYLFLVVVGQIYILLFYFDL